jgi:polar amino acid transport system substrate-binding protein
VKERGELVVLTWPHQESIFSRRMVEYGQEGLKIIGGVDVDLMKLYAEHLGVELRVEPVRPDFAALIPSLLGGEGDVIASSLSITRERGKVLDFSLPYYEVHKAVVVMKGSPIRSVEDLTGKVASVARGTSHEEQLRAMFPDLEIRPVQFMLENYQAVVDGEADYTLVDSSSAMRVLEEFYDLGQNLEVAFQFPESDHFAFAVAKGSDLKESLDRFVEEIRENGKLTDILTRHSAPGYQTGGTGSGE